MRRVFKYLFSGLFVSLFFIVLISPARAEWNDLEVSEITINPKEPALNEPSTITVKVKSSGDTTLISNAGISGYDLNDRNFVLTSVEVPEVSVSKPLEPGKSVSYKIYGYFTQIGDQNFGFEANANSQLIESKVSNNYLNKKITVVKPYDLLVKEIEVQPSKPVPGQKVYIRVTLKNNGFARIWTAAGINSYSYVWQDFEQSSKEIPVINSENDIEGGEEFEYVFYGKFLSEGEKSLSFSIDDSDQLDEKNEGNNDKTVAVKIYSENSQDLAVGSFTLSNNYPLVDEELVISTKIKNTGDTSLTDSTGLLWEDDLVSFPVIMKDLDFDFGNFEVTDYSISSYPTLEKPLQPDKLFTLTYTGYFSEVGEQNLFYEVNKNSRLLESDLTNNRNDKSVIVYATKKDRDAFTIEEYHVEFFSSTAAKISWEDSRKTTGLIKYKRKDYTNFNTTKDKENESTNHSVIVSDLEPGIAYSLIIESNLNTVTHTLEDLVFTMPQTNEISIVSAPAAAVDGNSVTISWETDLLTTTKVYYRNVDKQVDYKTSEVKNEHTREHKIKIKDLGLGKFEFYVVSENKAGEILVSIKYNFVIASTEAPVEEEEEEIVEEVPIDEPDIPESTESEEEVGESNTENTKVITNMQMYDRLKGKIVLKVESNGEAFYINPGTESRHYLGRPDDAFQVMREQGVGITNLNLSQIPIGESSLTGPDNDGDGLSDIFEDAVGTDKNTADTDSDGYDDAIEVFGGYNPIGFGNMGLSDYFASSQAGKIFLQVEGNGEAWYVNPGDNKRYFLGRPADAFSVMRELGLGISNNDFENL